MNFERGPLPQAELFEGVHTIEQALGRYEQLAEQAFLQHRTGLIQATQQHEANLTVAKYTPETHDIPTILNATKTEVEQAVLPAVADVDMITRAAAHIMPTLLDTPFQELLTTARWQAAHLNAYKGVNTIMQAPGSMQPALRAAFDYTVLGDYQRNIAANGIDSIQANGSLDNGSSLVTRQAMKAALDAKVLFDVQSNANLAGVESRRVMQLLACASSIAVRRAMKASLDSKIFEEASVNVSAFGIDSPYVGQKLDYASSDIARLAMDFRLREPRGQHFSVDGLHRPAANRPRKLTVPGLEIADAISLIDSVVAGNRQYLWMKDEPVANIQRIVNTVNTLRSKAQAAGETISDRRVYLRYRSKAETNPKFIKSVQILEAMMGGDINGTLPF